MSEFRKVDAGRGVEWFKQGWALFMKNPGIWIAIAAIMLAVMLLSLIPFLGIVIKLAMIFLMPVFLAGLMLGCQTLAGGGKFGIDTLFAGFKQNTGNLMLLGVVSIAGSLIVGAIVAVLMLVVVFIGGGMDGGSLALLSGGLIIAALVGLALSVPLMMALYFAAPLVMLRNMAPFDAVKASFFACLGNILPFLVYGVIAFVLCFVALLPIGLGMLVMWPVLMGALYASYVDIFEDGRAPSAAS